jgi:hypothetical protein
MIYTCSSVKHRYKFIVRPPMYTVSMINEEGSISQTLRLTYDQYCNMLDKLQSTGWQKDVSNGFTSVQVSGSTKRRSRSY